MSENSKDIGAGRYSDDGTNKLKEIQEIQEILDRNNFEISVTIKREEINVKKYDSGLLRITLKNLSPQTILPQIPLDSLAFFFETEKVRHDLRGDTARDVLANIITEKEKWIERMSEKEQKKHAKEINNVRKKNEKEEKQQNIFNQNSSRNNNDMSRDKNKLSNAINSRTENDKKINIGKTNEIKKDNNSLGGMFDYANERRNKQPQQPRIVENKEHKEQKNNFNKNNNKESNPNNNDNNISLFSGNISNSNIRAREINGNYKKDIQQVKEKSKHIKDIEDKYSHVKQKKAVSQRRKNVIEFNEDTINMY